MVVALVGVTTVLQDREYDWRKVRANSSLKEVKPVELKAMMIKKKEKEERK